MIEKAKEQISSGTPDEALRFREWCVYIEDQPVSPKWLVNLITGADYSEFDSPTARRLLTTIGIKVTMVSRRVQKKRKSSKKLSETISYQLAHQLLEQEISAIKAFLSGRSEYNPANEKICDWITFCYTLGLYEEGSKLFEQIDNDDVNDWFYERTKKLARLCSLRAIVKD